MKYVHLGLIHLTKGVLAFVLYIILSMVFVSMSMFATKLIITLLMFITIIASLVEFILFVGDMIRAYVK
jgi:4-amino-4-deoxy-L-arabinose transferase-like glycosyltransferase